MLRVIPQGIVIEDTMSALKKLLCLFDSLSLLVILLNINVAMDLRFDLYQQDQHFLKMQYSIFDAYAFSVVESEK